MKTSRPLLGAGATLGALALVLGSATPAFAADPTINGDIVTVGDAQFHMDEFGILWGWDVADAYFSDGYMEYPSRLSFSGSVDDEFPLCVPNSPPSQGMTTVEANGDFTIACPASVWGTTGLTASLTYRMYAEAPSGYLVRQLVTVTNSTSSVIDITGDLGTLLLHEWTGEQGTAGFTTSSGAQTIAANDTWFISSLPDGAGVVQTGAWALTGSAPASGISADSVGTLGVSATFGASDSTFAPGETKFFVSFTNMVLPATADPDGAEAAYLISLAQTDEFASFSGRLIAGLDPDASFVGWGAPVNAAAPVAVVPAAGETLPDTGVASEIELLASGSAALALLGGLLVVRSRLRARTAN